MMESRENDPYTVCKAYLKQLMALIMHACIFYGSSTWIQTSFSSFSTVKQKQTTTDIIKYFCFDTLIILFPSPDN